MKSKIPDLKIKQPFNGLSEAELERLAILAEECVEVAQIVMKIIRHGYASFHPDRPNGPNNRGELEKELGDVRFAIMLLTCAGDVDKEQIHTWAHNKGEDIRQYVHHQTQTLLNQATEKSK